MLQQAKWYVEKHKWSVIPVIPELKAPALAQGEVAQYRERFPTEAELQKWFKNTNNWVGIVTGKLSNLSVLDGDTRDSVVPATPVMARTPHGWHGYYQYMEELKNHVKAIPNYDIRTQGGFVVAPPSAGYSFINPYFISSNLPKFPIHLFPKETSGETKLPLDIAGLLAEITEGNRNDGFTRIVGKMHRAKFSPSDMLVLLSPYAEKVHFHASELASIINSVSRYVDEPETTESESVETFLENIKETEWIVKGLVAKGAFQFVAGLPETNKTWLLLDLAIEAARGGGKWLGKFDTKAARVLVIDQERYKGETQRRVKALLMAKGVKPSSLRGNLYVRCGSTTRIDLEDSFRAFRAELQRIKPDIILIDSFATFHTKEENNRQEIQLVLERIKQLRNEFGCTIIFIDHEGKSVFQDHENNEVPSAFRMVGSVGKVAAAEIVLTVRKYDPQTCMVYVTKNTLAPCIESFPLAVSDVPNGVIVSSPTEN